MSRLRNFTSLAIIAFGLHAQLPHAGMLLKVRASCKQVGSCEEAVALWCNGYSRADGDHDGIPCENVCHSVAEVEEIKARQGC